MPEQLSPTIADGIPEGCAVIAHGLVNPKVANQIQPRPDTMASKKASGFFELHDMLLKDFVSREEIDEACGRSCPHLTRSTMQQLMKFYSTGEWHRHGWYLVQRISDGKLKLVYRDPLVYYASEYAAHLTEEQKVPDLQFKDRNLYAEKPAPAPKTSTPRAPRQPKPAGTTTSGSTTVDAQGNVVAQGSMPGVGPKPGGLIDKVKAVPGMFDDLSRILNDFVADDDTRVAVLGVIDQFGFKGPDATRGISEIQKAGKVKPGFFKMLVDFGGRAAAQGIGVAAA